MLNRIGHAALAHLNRLTTSLEDDLGADLAAVGIQIGAAYDPEADVSRPSWRDTECFGETSSAQKLWTLCDS